MSEILLLLIGVLWGVGVSPFLTPEVARASLVAGGALLALWGADDWRKDQRVAVAALAAAVAWGLTGPLFRDTRPSLTYSLQQLSDDEAVPYQSQFRAGAWYRLRIDNASDVDVSDLRASLHLPSHVSGPPIVIRESRTDQFRAKATSATVIFKPEGAPAVPIIGFSNVALIEAGRLLSRGALDIAIPSVGRGGQADANSHYGVLNITRRHKFMNTDVNDVEAFPIVRLAEDVELLGPEGNQSVNTPTFGPQIREDQLHGSGDLKFEMTTE